MGGGDQAPTMLLRAARRIVVLGGPGAGKSTFARGLSENLGYPLIHLDRLFFGPNWTPVDDVTARRALTRALGAGDWIVEGVYPQVNDLTLARADLAIWLDQPAWRRLWRSWRKTVQHRGKPRDDRPDGCDEVFGWRYVATVLMFGAWTARTARLLAQAAPDATIVVLRGDKAAQTFHVHTSVPNISDNLP